MKKPLRFCPECYYSAAGYDKNTRDRCSHPEVLGRDPEALASNNSEKYPYCSHERAKHFWHFPACGVKGKLWEPEGI